MLFSAICKGIFGKNRKKQFFCFFGIVVLFSILIIWKFSGGFSGYYFERIQHIFLGNDRDYMAVQLRETMKHATMDGNRSLESWQLTQDNYSIFLLSSFFQYFGKAAGILVIFAYLIFLFTAFWISVRQQNRIGFLIGMACSFSILVRFLAYLGVNMGYPLWWNVLVPFLSYGKVSAVMNGIYVGLILCVYRNSSILKEEKIEQKTYHFAIKI